MPPTRLLFGPVDPAWAARFLSADPNVRWVGHDATGWGAVAARLPAGWEADALVVRPGYASLPAWVWTAPVPVVALAHDPDLLWHTYRGLLPLADLVLTDGPAVGRLHRAGVSHARPANLYGLDADWLAEVDAPPADRDIDVLFVGNLNPAVQGERLPWLGRVAELGDRFHVVIRTGVFGAEYRALVRRAKVCFNRSIRGECNQRALEAAAGGAVLLQEAENAEVPVYLAPGAEYVRYSAADLEDTIARVLADGAGRAAVSARARARARGYGWLPLVRAALDGCAGEWAEAGDRAARRTAAAPGPDLRTRVWVRAGRAVGPDADPALAADLAAAGDDTGQAVVTPAAAVPCLARAAAAGNRVAGVGLGIALAGLGRGAEAGSALRGVLTDLAARPLAPGEAEACPYPGGFDALRTGWDRAGWDHPDDPAAAGAAKHALLRWRAAAALAELTGDVDDYRAAVAARPDHPATRAALGHALVRAGRTGEAIDHLAAAVSGNPFDAPAAAALAAALTASGRAADAERVRARHRVPAAPPRPLPATPNPPPPGDGLRVVSLSPEAFAARYGAPDTSAALCGFTPPADARAVLALVAHLRPLRVLEIGTAAGHMTANLTAWTPPGAVVYSVGVAGTVPSGGAPEQAPEAPPRPAFAAHAGHFGLGHKARLVVADSRAVDLGALAPLDLAFVDGGHDFATARADTAGVYHALRPGGCLVWHDWDSPTPWVEVRRAVASLGLPEPVYHAAGTGVAFLFKGEGVGAAAGADTPRVAVAWEGEFAPTHSLAAVNRAVCLELAARGQAVGVLPLPPAGPVGAVVAPPPGLAALVNRPLAADVTVRHRWPPDFTPPAGRGAFVLVQPWEFGRLPRAWVGPIVAAVDEVWAYSRAVERCYVASGVPADRVRVVPLGVNPDRFRPGLDPLSLATDKRVRLLFVGGTIPRKGFDALLAAYRRAFTAADDVCLVVKDVGAGTFYRGQTAERAVADLAADPAAPAVEYLAADLAEEDLPRLYAACDALVHPYRGEGFALPVLEAMACGLPVAVTAGGPTDEFVPPAAGWRIPARLAYFPDERVGDLPTAGRPWWLEPDPDALVGVLRAVAADAAGRAARGAAARRAALGW
ncbi:glycosyltransferase, partial [bacterium]|nr:glycosyltransferase [bacterium]